MHHPRGALAPPRPHAVENGLRARCMRLTARRRRNTSTHRPSSRARARASPRRSSARRRAASSTVMKESLGDLKALQKSLPGPPNDYFDPLNLATMTFDWGPQGEEATIGWLRHSEIKHGRVAMAGFLGFIAHCTPIVSGEHKFPTAATSLAPRREEQWDNIPLIGKLQILIAIGMLESYGEAPATRRATRALREGRQAGPATTRSGSAARPGHANSGAESASFPRVSASMLRPAVPWHGDAVPVGEVP